MEKPAFGDYGRTVWEVYTERRGSDLPLASSMEQALMKWWWDQGYPVRVVAMALRLCKGKGRNLMYYAPAVDEEYERFRTAVGFGGSDFLLTHDTAQE
jgi:hypothetical protein